MNAILHDGSNETFFKEFAIVVVLKETTQLRVNVLNNEVTEQPG